MLLRLAQLGVCSLGAELAFVCCLRHLHKAQCSAASLLVPFLACRIRTDHHTSRSGVKTIDLRNGYVSDALHYKGSGINFPMCTIGSKLLHACGKLLGNYFSGFQVMMTCAITGENFWGIIFQPFQVILIFVTCFDVFYYPNGGILP